MRPLLLALAVLASGCASQDKLARRGFDRMTRAMENIESDGPESMRDPEMIGAAAALIRRMRDKDKEEGSAPPRRF